MKRVKLRNFTGTISTLPGGRVSVKGRGNVVHKKKNVAEGFYSGGIFHPIRASYDYNAKRAGESNWQFEGGHAVKGKGKKRK